MNWIKFDKYFNTLYCYALFIYTHILRVNSLFITISINKIYMLERQRNLMKKYAASVRLSNMYPTRDRL